MTTIAFRDGIMAADSRAYSGRNLYVGMKRKIHRVNGMLVGISSSTVGVPEKVRRLIEDNGIEGSFEDPLDCSAIVVTRDGRVFYFDKSDTFSGPVQSEFLAIGSGEDYAMGAMAHGASAEDAVRIAIQYDPWSAGEICIERLAGA